MKAMQTETSALQENNTWETAGLPDSTDANGFIRLSIMLIGHSIDIKLVWLPKVRTKGWDRLQRNIFTSCENG